MYIVCIFVYVYTQTQTYMYTNIHTCIYAYDVSFWINKFYNSILSFSNKINAAETRNSDLE